MTQDSGSSIPLHHNFMIDDPGRVVSVILGVLTQASAGHATSIVEMR
jgi:hypothetical protein